MIDASPIDWELAEKIGTSLVPPGPRLSARQRNEVVADLKACIRCTPQFVADATGMNEIGETKELVIDRRNAVRVIVQSARSMLDRLSLPESKTTVLAKGQAKAGAIALGSVIALLGARVLGQYDPFSPASRLVLIAPNIVSAEKQLKVDPHDFRLWVCLHEQTHRAQFSHAPWLVDYLVELASRILEEEGVDWGSLSDRIVTAAQPENKALKATSLRIFSAVSSPELVQSLERVTAVMSLLEGHADVMMDRAGSEQIPTLSVIRAAFEQRRARRGLGAILGRFIGLDAKLAQYQDGARFCREVIDAAGVATLNQAFRSVDDLPSLKELHDPKEWLARQGREE